MDCLICRKHRGHRPPPGGTIYEDGLIYAGHAYVDEALGTAYLGYLLLETRRHVPGLAELNESEAQSIGSWVARLSRALKAVVGAEHVYLFVLGHHVDHLHLHLVPRYPGTPREYWGVRVDEWPGAPRGDLEEIADLCGRLRNWL